MANYDINLTFGYANSDSKRTYTFGVDSLDGAALVTGVKAINASLAAGTSDSLNTFFVSDNGDYFSSITAAQSVFNGVTVINLDTEGDATNG